MNPITNHQSLRILAVDDDLDALSNMRDLLEQLGYQVETADSGEAAIACCEQNNFDVALLDFKMPKLSGLDVAEYLHDHQPGVVSLLITAFPPAQLQTACAHQKNSTRKPTVEEILSKPLDVRKLIATLDHVRLQRTILVVDDDDDLCQNLQEILNERRWRVVTAGGAREAVEVLKQRSIDVALIDLRLGDGNGLELIDMIREQWPNTNPVLMTGFRDDLLAEGLSDASPANHICFKPLDVPSVLDYVAKNLDDRNS